MNNSLDIVIPCFNPPAGWEQVLLSEFNMLVKLLKGIDIRCILVNDGSSKGVSKSEIDFLHAVIPSFTYYSLNKNFGKGYAVRYGFERAKSEVVGFTDVDFPYETVSIAKMFNSVNADSADIVIGHRDPEYYRSIPLFRRILSKSLQQVIRFLLHLPVSDTQSGLKLFNKSGKSALLHTKINGYLFDIELLKIAQAEKLRILSTPLRLRTDIQMKEFSFRTLIKEAKVLFQLITDR